MGPCWCQAGDLWLVGEQAQVTRALYRPGAITHLQFREDIAHMAFDRTESQHQGLSNLLVGGTPSK